MKNNLITLPFILFIGIFWACLLWYTPQEKPLERPAKPEKVLTPALESPLPLQRLSETPEYLQMRIKEAWQFDTGLFLDALLEQENGPEDNPWNFTAVFLEDIRVNLRLTQQNIDDLDLSDRYTAQLLVLWYGKIHSARNSHHMAAMFNKGPTGYKAGKDYADRVCNLLEFYMRKGATNDR